ncbi:MULTISPECIES: TIGR01457 family HAD-type hydrolase [Ureibacillus]|jgi:4-nitrophenyl phosphatase|uniref:4-nitrophenyl phosphatase n=1 Tax=Ureibacillus thermosphaericus TaxID=51173 RepID=A0A840PTP0_URETH|nr:TIGR01457 family HAD-type hydrolase [Ureibacillus thermosphaericus]MBB5148564.1 4-nitrophenyl phosphatase [Ureibacillus thermosphaericus]NKZ31056.1 TIGR01457 family HAD-type hydrolase [Ureibacillus thermosphaericus]
MKHYRAYCFDLDGTVYRGKEVIPTAIQFIHQLEDKQLDYFFVTNNSSKTPSQIKQTLQQFGLNVSEKQIYSSSLVTAKYVKKHFGQAKVFVIGQDGIRYALQQEGIDIVEENPDVVVMGIDRKIDYEKLTKACIAVQNGATLIGTNEDIKFPTEKGFHPGNGSFVKLVSQVSNVEPMFMGKPSPVMLEMIQQEYGYNKNEMLMIGDNYDTDILCGIRFGCDTVHVNTGVVNTEKVKEKGVQPTYCINDLSEFEL